MNRKISRNFVGLRHAKFLEIWVLFGLDQTIEGWYIGGFFLFQFYSTAGPKEIHRNESYTIQYERFEGSDGFDTQEKFGSGRYEW